MPDTICLHRLSDGRQLCELPLPAIVGRGVDEVLHKVASSPEKQQFRLGAVAARGDTAADGDELTLDDICYSFGIAHPGAVQLHNYPDFLRRLERFGPDGKTPADVIDLAAVDILRDRERGVPRYNQFRKLLHLPPAKSFAALTSNKEWARELEEVYQDVDRVDLMVGMFAEDPPKGFGFSDTAFRIFILMASRRLKSDRFFTTDYNANVYTQLGLDWINENTMRSVLLRHFPGVAPVLRQVRNAFAPWPRVDSPPAAGGGAV
jgi:hypothetical protein